MFPATDIAPNPSKVLIILEELSLPYQTHWMESEDIKKPPYEAINPNGKLPGDYPTSFVETLHAIYLECYTESLDVAIHDPNTNVILWETGAIIRLPRRDLRYGRENHLPFQA